MVILLGGSSHVGKTLIAQRLIEQLHCPCISLDRLKMAFIRSGRTELTVNDDYQMRYWMWPFVAEMVKDAIDNGQDMIVEGCYIPGEWAQSFSDEYLKSIRCVFLVMSERYLRENFGSIGKYADIVQRRVNDVLDLDRLVMCSRNFKEDCLKSHTRYIEIDTAYSEKVILSAVQSVIADQQTFGDGVVI